MKGIDKDTLKEIAGVFGFLLLLPVAFTVVEFLFLGHMGTCVGIPILIAISFAMYKCKKLGDG